MQEISRAMERPAAAGPATIAVDASPENRPGVPREAEPRPDEGAHWVLPPRQQPTVRVFRRQGLEELTPVFGTAQPPHGVSGLLRWLAYRAPEHRARHWAGLMLADRIDILETRLGRALGPPLRRSGYGRSAYFLERHALPALLIGATAGWILARRPARRIREAGGRAADQALGLGRDIGRLGRALTEHLGR
jgi:hypothetical protein